MQPALKWIASRINFFSIAALWTFGAAMVGTSDLLAAEWLIGIGNLILLITLITSPQIDRDGQRPTIIFLLLLVASAISYGEWFWIEGKRNLIISSNPNTAQVLMVPMPASGGSGGVHAGEPSAPEGILPSNLTSTQSSNMPTVPKTSLEKQSDPKELVALKARAAILSSEIFKFLTDRLMMAPPQPVNPRSLLGILICRTE